MKNKPMKKAKVEKRIDEIVEVAKFNPFHDARGRFSNKNGFASYSANPNTKAGAMAIARSAAGGHGKTLNAHRQSYGETIDQNADWLGSGIGGNKGPYAQGLRQHVEPVRGLQGASRMGAIWQRSNQQQGRITKPGKQPAQQAQQQGNQQQTASATKPAAAKPAQAKPAAQNTTQQQNATQAQQQTTTAPKGLAANTAGVQLTHKERLAVRLRNGKGEVQDKTSTTRVADSHDQERVAGKDISRSFDAAKIRGKGAALEKVARAQGWDKAPTVTDDLETFQKAARQSGRVLIRTVHPNGSKSSLDVCEETMTKAGASLNGTGMKAYGRGLYTVDVQYGSTADSRLSKKIASGQDHSFGYGDTQMMSTIHPDAKIASKAQATKLKQEFRSLPYTEQCKFGNDHGAYIASKGYDGATWDAWSATYTTMYNMSAMIFYSNVADKYA